LKTGNRANYPRKSGKSTMKFEILKAEQKMAFVKTIYSALP